ncbi:MAG: HD domain-containing protein [Myxococcota bacterium]|nr:HD domain-containing protein [Myxococcota bacterium]
MRERRGVQERDDRQEAPVTPDGAEPEAPHTSRNVLYVDDDPQQLRVVQKLLAQEADQVHVALDPHRALETIESTEFALFIADFRMPGMDGIRFLERAATVQPDACRILISGQANFETALRAINRAGIFRLLTKPWSGPDLRSSVRQALLQYRYVRENQAFAARLDDANRRLRDMNRRLDAMVGERTSALLLSLCNALDLRDTETQWHSRRVALYARRLAIEVGLSPYEQIDAERGALLHDVGKIGVPDAILLKPGKLTEEEWVRMRTHCDLGARILAGIPFLDNARLLVREHHERWDGKGYSRGLRGERICIGARIFAVIDAYDAITSDRPYRLAADHDAAVAEIAKNRGTQFDPAIVDAFLRIPRADFEGIRAKVQQADDESGE